jgi:hypothetical protein
LDNDHHDIVDICATVTKEHKIRYFDDIVGKKMFFHETDREKEIKYSFYNL